MKQVVIIGAGPAGLTAAWEGVGRGLNCVVLEADPRQLGGISQTVRLGGHRFDIGGHRFYTKNAEIMALWRDTLGPDLLSVPRLSRILYRNRFYHYPLQIRNALTNLGWPEAVRCLISYLRARLRPRRPVRSFEDWVTNRFGQRLFSIFFKTYTEKVWGMPCSQISADWAAQRIQGLSLWKALLGRSAGARTLVDRFLYPRQGPGMMWERLAEQLQERGVSVEMGCRVDRIVWGAQGVTGVSAQGRSWDCAEVISSMPLRHLVQALDPAPPESVLEAARGLKYRDFLTVALVIENPNMFPDQWIYVHEPRVQVGRIQNYKNWSPDMVASPEVTGLGLEYFCFEGDGLWNSADSSLVELAIRELNELGLLGSARVCEATVIRMPRAYPVYDPGYEERVGHIRRFLEGSLPNLQVVGRNGMHRYNNQDHAMLTGILAARNVAGHGRYDLWRVNGEAEYLEAEVVEVGRLVPRTR